MYFDNRDPNATYSPKIDYNSADPGLKYNMDYYNTTGDWGKFLKDYSDYNKEYNNCSNTLCYTYSKNFVYKPHTAYGMVGTSAAAYLGRRNRL